MWGIICAVFVIAICGYGYYLSQKRINEKKKAGTFKQKEYKSVFKMDEEKVKKLNTLDKK